MNPLFWILAGGLAMSAIALVGGLTTMIRPSTLERLLLPLVALSAGTLLGGAFFHMIPEAGTHLSPVAAAAWVLGGFTLFLAVEQFLHWHHCQRAAAPCRNPVTYLILIGDALHNFLGGLAVAGAFLLDPRLGATAWLAAAAHEVPQELGDFAVLVHGGWERRRALVWNVISGLTFPAGALLAYAASFRIEVTPIVLLGAGSFVYIGASDLVPEIRAHPNPRRALVHLACFAAGILLMLLLAKAFGD